MRVNAQHVKLFGGINMVEFILIMVLVWSWVDSILTNIYLRKVKKHNIRGIANREWYEWEL